MNFLGYVYCQKISKYSQWETTKTYTLRQTTDLDEVLDDLRLFPFLQLVVMSALTLRVDISSLFASHFCHCSNLFVKTLFFRRQSSGLTVEGADNDDMHTTTDL